MKFEAWLRRIHEASEKAWKEERKENTAHLHNRLVEIIAEEEALLDEAIIAVEILLQELLKAKMEEIEKERPG